MDPPIRTRPVTLRAGDVANERNCDDRAVDVLVSALAGPVIFRRIVTRETIDAGFVATLTSTVLAGARAA